MVRDNANETPAIENLFNKQDAEKIRSLMSEVYNSKDKVEFFKRLFEENRVSQLRARLHTIIKGDLFQNFANCFFAATNTVFSICAMLMHCLLVFVAHTR